MKIAAVYVLCYRSDVELTRICVASIREHHPDVPIHLVKDVRYGTFSTRDIEHRWNVKAAITGTYGWSYAKLEILTNPKRERCLILDSDTVVIGPLLERVAAFDEDFIVSPHVCSKEDQRKLYYDAAKLKTIDPAFTFPGFNFNAGQIVATTGMLNREDFDPFFDWKTMKVIREDIFQLAEQGLVNYVLQKKAARGEITLRQEPFMVWPGDLSVVKHIRVADIAEDRAKAEVVHWAGLRWGKTVEEMPRADILKYYEDLYYARLPLGDFLNKWRKLALRARRSLRGILRVLHIRS